MSTTNKQKAALLNLLYDAAKELYIAEEVVQDHVKTTPANREAVLLLANKLSNANGMLKTILDSDFWD